MDAPSPDEPLLTHYKSVQMRIDGGPAELMLKFPQSTDEIPPGKHIDYVVRIVEPDPTPGHIALGQYMDAWSKMEMPLRSLLAHVLNAEESQMPALVNSLGMRGQRDVISNLGAEMLDDLTTKRLLALMDRVKEASTRRNYIVHGYWSLTVIVKRYGERFTHKIIPLRCYNPTSRDERQRMLDNPFGPEMAKYEFSVPRIRQLTRALGTLGVDLQTFNHEVFLNHLI